MSISINNPNLLPRLLEEKKKAVEYQKRRHEQWNDNYLLYRLKVSTDNITQRQAVCIPLMKGTIKTIASKTDEDPDIIFEDKAGDMDREIVINEKWRDDAEATKLRLLDAIDKKQVWLYGRSHKKFNWRNGKWEMEVKDIYDVLVDPKTKPHDIQTANYIIERGIYRTIEEIAADPKYDEEAVNKLRLYRQELEGNETTGEQPSHGQTLNDQYSEDIEARKERLETLGEEDYFDTLSGADFIVELNQHFTRLWDKQKKKWVKYVCIVADEAIVLYVKPLKETLGIEKWPFDSWTDDLEATDYWSDGIADILRVPNQMINVWYSQYMENRTLRNYGMNFYDETAGENWEPQEFEARPFGWYPLPGNPQEVYKKVDIPELTGLKEDIQFLVNIAEKETASSDIEKGMIEDARRTLGEIEIAVSKAQDRITSMAKFYRESWKNTADIWYDLNIANLGKKKVELYKKNGEGQLIGKTVGIEDIKSPKGYRIKVQSASEKSVQQIDELNKLFAIKKEFPNNPPLNKAIQKRALLITKLNPEEVQEILDYEEEMGQMMANQPQPAYAQPTNPVPGQAPNQGRGQA